MISFMASACFSSIAVTIGVSIVPGQTALMRIPRGAYSSAALLVSPITPCLVAWYAARRGRPTRPPNEEQLTIAPLPCSRIRRSSCFMHAHTPRRLIAFTRSNSSAASSAMSLGGACTPALLNAASSRPKVETVCSTMAATSASSATSQRMPIALWPAATRPFAADRAASSLMSANVIAAPASANALAVARPIPDAAPVTSATPFSKDEFMYAFLSGSAMSEAAVLAGPLLEYFFCNRHRREDVRPADIEGEVCDGLRGLHLRQPVIHRLIEVRCELHDLAVGDQCADGD